MKLIGFLLSVGGWLLAVAGVTWTSSTGVRLIFCLAGIAITITGILGFLNKGYVQNAVWKK
jgi:hypothetical protein